MLPLSRSRRVWRNGARCRGAMVVPRQGRRERPYRQIWARPRTRPRGEQRGPTAQPLFRQALLLIQRRRELAAEARRERIVLAEALEQADHELPRAVAPIAVGAHDVQQELERALGVAR